MYILEKGKTMKQGVDFRQLTKTITSKSFGLLILAALILSAASPLIASAFLTFCYLDRSGSLLCVLTSMATILLVAQVHTTIVQAAKQRKAYHITHTLPPLRVKQTVMTLFSFYVAVSSWLALAIFYTVIADSNISIARAITLMLKSCYSI